MAHARKMRFLKIYYASFVVICSALSAAGQSADHRSITVAIAWETKFGTIPDKDHPERPAANPCWPFSVSVASASGSTAAYISTSTTARYRKKEDSHVCTFEMSGPAGVPLEIEPAIPRVTLIGAAPLPRPFDRGYLKIRYTRGITPAKRLWTLGNQGVYLKFTYGFVMY